MNKATQKSDSFNQTFYSRIKEYELIMRTGGTFVGGITVYGNQSQLAVVSLDGINEFVKYIEYKNIRAVLIRRHSLKVKALIIGFALLGLLTGIYFTGDGFGVAFMVWVFSLTLLAGALMLGFRNCSVRIVTDVNDHRLGYVNRYSKAKVLLNEVVRRMEPYLEQPSDKAEDLSEIDSGTAVESLEQSTAAVDEEFS